MDSKTLRDIVRPGGYISLNKRLIQKLGLMCAYILSDLMDKHAFFEEQHELDENDGFYYTQEMRSEAWQVYGDAQRRYLETLAKQNLVLTLRKGIPARLYFYLQWNEIKNLIVENTQNPDVAKSGNRSPSCRVSRQLDIAKCDNAIYRERTDYKEQSPECKKPTSNAKTKTPIQTRTDIFLPMAELLASIIKQKKRISTPPQKIRQWANEIRKLSELSKVNPQRIHRALVWYSEHVGEEFVVVIESGSSLREKFARLETAMEKGMRIRTTPIESNGSSDDDDDCYVGPDGRTHRR